MEMQKNQNKTILKIKEVGGMKLPNFKAYTAIVIRLWY